MHASTFEYLKPSDFQVSEMQVLRDATRSYADVIERTLPDGPDKTYVLRKLRELADVVECGADSPSGRVTA